MTDTEQALTRPHLDSIPSYRPGRRPDQLAAVSSLGHVVKLSSNEMPYGPLPGVTEALASYAADLNRYPDMFATQLRSELAAKYGVTPGHVVTGCGSVALCENLALVAAGPGDEIVFGWRSFEAYPIVVARLGATPVQVRNTADHRLDVEAIVAAVTPRTRAVFLCSPNNPTGALISTAELAWALEHIPKNVLVILDEAYREFIADGDTSDGVSLLPEHPNLAVIRTFSKAWGLAALRVGYLIAAEEIADTVRKIVTPFSTSGAAQVAALAALRQPEEMARRVGRVVAERERVTEMLRKLHPDVPRSQGNFVWLPLGARATTVAEAFEAQGVIVRAFSEADPHASGIRITIGTPDENDVMLAAATEILAERPLTSR